MSAYPEIPARMCFINLNENDIPESAKPLKDQPTPEKEQYLKSSFTLCSAHPSIQKLLLVNHDIFSLGRQDIGKCDSASLKIFLVDDARVPVYRKQFHIPEVHHKVLLEHLTNWLKLKIVSLSLSKYNSPIFCVLEKNRTLRPLSCAK